MDYSLLAGQLLNVQANLLQVPAYQQLSKMVRGEMFVLNYLATHETAIHPKELSKKMAVSTARITSLLHHMEEKGLIARSSGKPFTRFPPLSILFSATILCRTGENLSSFCPTSLEGVRLSDVKKDLLR